MLGYIVVGGVCALLAWTIPQPAWAAKLTADIKAWVAKKSA